ncbi:MAG: hypothetical protein M3O30_16625, partial [Planctomycetota bacterium]|nr:hypothetical protein [Planctomycetota bacterium]
MIAVEILRRHERLGSFHELKRPGSKAVSSRPLVFMSMCLFHGKRVEHYDGLHVTAQPDEIGDSVGMRGHIAYPAIRELEAAGLIRRVRIGGRVADQYDIPMPEILNVQRVRPHTLEKESRFDKDLLCAPAHANQIPARAPAHAWAGAHANSDLARAPAHTNADP